MEAVNLLPGYARPGHRWASAGKELSARRVLVGGGAAACVAAAALGLTYVHERAVINDRRATLAEVQARVTAAEVQAAPLRAKQAEVAARTSAAATISGSRTVWEQVLRQLAQVLPGEVYLTSLQAKSTTPTTGAAATAVPAGFTVMGSAASHVRVALVLERLELLPWLSNVTLQSSTHGGTADRTSGSLGAGDQFSITAGFAGPVAPVTPATPGGAQ
jgi:Tfp pilus assembly protein PilN